MRIYVDELPQCCDECPCCNKDKDYGSCCNLGTYEYEDYYQIIYKHPRCPLQSLSEYTKQVRKEVCDKVYNVFTNQNMWRALKDWWLNTGNCKELKDCLNDIANNLSVSDIVKKNTNNNQLLALIEAIGGANCDKN